MPPKKHQGNTTDSKGKDRAKTTFSQAEIDTAQEHFPPQLTSTNPNETSLVSIANNWGVKVSVEGVKGAKNPVNARSMLNTFSALSLYKQQPEDNFWTDILDRGREKTGKYRFLNSIISKPKYSKIITEKLNCTEAEIYSYVRICALTGLPFIPGIDSQDLDHCESANRTGKLGIPITSRNCSAGHVWESTILVASTLSPANRSAGDSSYFSPFKKLSLGPLSMLINEKATLQISKDINSCCLKHPFHEFRTMVPGDIKRMIDAVQQSEDTSPFLQEVITVIMRNIDEHIEFHISNLKLWPTLKDILRVMNRALYEDMKSLFTKSRIDLKQTKIKDTMSDIMSLPTLYDVEDDIEFSSDTELLNHAKIYILRPFGFMHYLPFVGYRYEKLEGTSWRRSLDKINGIGESRNIGMGDHAINAYAMAKRANEPIFKARPPPPPPPLPKLDLENVEHLDDIQSKIANWLDTHPTERNDIDNNKPGAVDRTADECLKDLKLSEIYNISGVRPLHIKNMVKGLLNNRNYSGDFEPLKLAINNAVKNVDMGLVELEHRNRMDEDDSPENAVVLADTNRIVGVPTRFLPNERRASVQEQSVSVPEQIPRANVIVDISSPVKRRTEIFGKPQKYPKDPVFRGDALISSDPMRDNKRKRSPSISPNSSKNRGKESKSRSPSKKGGKYQTRKNRR